MPGIMLPFCRRTGRAAQRMGSIQGIEPSTIHRLLGYQPRNAARDGGAKADDAALQGKDEEWRGFYKHDRWAPLRCWAGARPRCRRAADSLPSAAKQARRQGVPEPAIGSDVVHRLRPLPSRPRRHDPLPAGAVLVDEASMLSLPLAAALVDALRAKCQLVLVGDVDQLPPVGALACVRAGLPAGMDGRVRCHKQGGQRTGCRPWARVHEGGGRGWPGRARLCRAGLRVPAPAAVVSTAPTPPRPPPPSTAGPGAVLHSLIASGLAPVVDLREIFRQAAQSAIITSALAGALLGACVWGGEGGFARLQGAAAAAAAAVIGPEGRAPAVDSRQARQALTGLAPNGAPLPRPACLPAAQCVAARCPCCRAWRRARGRWRARGRTRCWCRRGRRPRWRAWCARRCARCAPRTATRRGRSWTCRWAGGRGRGAGRAPGRGRADAAGRVASCGGCLRADQAAPLLPAANPRASAPPPLPASRQVISPMKKGPAGTSALNPMLQASGVGSRRLFLGCRAAGRGSQPGVRVVPAPPAV